MADTPKELVQSGGNRVPVPDPTTLTTQQLTVGLSSLRELIQARLDGYDKAIHLIQSAMDRSPSILEIHAEMKEKFLSINSKFDDRDRSMISVQKIIDDHIARLPSIQAVYAELKEKFNSVQIEFTERDKTVTSIQRIVEDNPSLVEVTVGRLRELHDEKFRSVQTQFTERDIRTEQTSRDSKVAVDAALQAAKEAVGEQNKSSALAIAKSEAATTKQIDQISVIINTMAKGLDDKIDDIKTRLTSIEGQRKGGGEFIGYFFGAAGILIAAIALWLKAK